MAIEDYVDYYRVLELEPGATQEEIKKAYFRLVRRYTPEKDPDMFQKIRQAYEVLKEDVQEQPEEFDAPSHPVVQYFYNNADSCIRRKEYPKACSLLEEALNITPDDPLLLLKLAIAYRHAGRNQKAAKAAEKLTKIRPESRAAWTICACSIYDRGWYKKALPAFQKAFSLGDREAAFLTDFAAAAFDNDETEMGLRILQEIQSFEKWDSKTLIYGINAFCGQTVYDLFSKSSLEGFLQRFVAFVRRNKRLIDDPDLLFSPFDGLGDADTSRLTFSHESMMKICAALEEVIRIKPGFEKEAEHQRCVLYGQTMERDPELNGVWAILSMCLLQKEDPDIDPERYHLFILDVKYWLLEHDSEMRRSVEIIRERYPFVAANYTEFLGQIDAGDLDEVKRDYAWEYQKLARRLHVANEPGRMTERWFSHREAGGSQSFDQGDEDSSGDWDGEEEEWSPRSFEPMEPVVREKEKVGRNDPCPCGSGKKFKKCCMGKGIYD